MTTTPLPPLPKEFACTNGVWGYYTADQMQAYATQARADLEAENQRLRFRFLPETRFYGTQRGYTSTRPSP